MKHRIYEKDGHWLFETTNNKGGNASATICESKEFAERLLALSDAWIGKTVRCRVTERNEITAKVVNAAVLHHKEELVDMLYIRWRKGTYFFAASKCEVIE